MSGLNTKVSANKYPHYYTPMQTKQSIYGLVNLDYFVIEKKNDETISFIILEIPHSRFSLLFSQLTKTMQPVPQKRQPYASYPKNIQNNGCKG